MNSIMSMPTELQLQLHQQMLFRQQQLVLRRHRPEDMPNPNAWPIPRLGGGPPLPPEVKVELQNRELWQQFHAETTEMVITKVGRRMFPSIQLTITGLERRARYCVLLEVEPASNRRHKYVGGVEKACGNAKGWTSAGPAEPQPRIDRRLYLHPESPATGAHWMQHPLSFHKLKLTNNAVDPRNNDKACSTRRFDGNSEEEVADLLGAVAARHSIYLDIPCLDKPVVLTSMHKYIPRIWIIRCDDATRLTDLYTHPASSFQFTETEFIAVTAYQNENITKLKINNNPFAKGFRETGQSRCKRKFQQADAEGSNRTDEEDGNVSSESESHRSSNHMDAGTQRPKTASSETGSLDDSGVSSCGGISPPLSSIHRNSPSRDVDRDAQPRLHRPWVDSSSQFPSSSMNTSSMSLSSTYSDLVPSSYYFRLFHPSLAMQSDFIRLQYQSIVNSKYH